LAPEALPVEVMAKGGQSTRRVALVTAQAARAAMRAEKLSVAAQVSRLSLVDATVERARRLTEAEEEAQRAALARKERAAEAEAALSKALAHAAEAQQAAEKARLRATEEAERAAMARTHRTAVGAGMAARFAAQEAQALADLANDEASKVEERFLDGELIRLTNEAHSLAGGGALAAAEMGAELALRDVSLKSIEEDMEYDSEGEEAEEAPWWSAWWSTTTADEAEKHAAKKRRARVRRLQAKAKSGRPQPKGLPRPWLNEEPTGNKVSWRASTMV
jgi:hypothetical protein